MAPVQTSQQDRAIHLWVEPSTLLGLQVNTKGSNKTEVFKFRAPLAFTIKGRNTHLI